MTERTNAYQVAASTPDPELPMLTIEDLGILRSVDQSAEEITVTITPTYSGCPAMREITGEGHRKLAANGIAPPAPAPRRSGPIPLTLTAPPPASCPRCGSADTRRTAEFSATACKSLHRCNACDEPFEGVKAL